jgi:hypothetical protein
MYFRCLLSFFLFISVFASISCGRAPSKSENLYLGQDLIYSLEPGARIVIPAQAAVNEYEKKFNYYKQYNVPLHRIIINSNSTLYFGLVVEPMPAQLTDLIQPDSLWSVIATKSDKHGYWGFLKYAKGGYNVRCLTHSNKTKQVHAINLFTTDSAVAISYYTDTNGFRRNLHL